MICRIVLHALRCVCHGIVVAAIEHLGAVRGRDSIVVVRQEPLDGHAAPAPPYARAIPARALGELSCHDDVN